MKVQRVRIGDVITLAREAVPVESHETYRTLGLLNRGRGVFAREPISGSDTKYAHYFRVKTDQLIYSKRFGWEGSVAVIPSHYCGYYVSAEFPTFDLDFSRVLPPYMNHVIKWVGFTAQLATATTGMGQRRQRVNVADFEMIEIPLPDDLDEQRRIVAHLDKFSHIAELARRRADLAAALLPATRNEVFSSL